MPVRARDGCPLVRPNDDGQREYRRELTSATTSKEKDIDVAKTPAAVLGKLNAELVKALKTPDFRERFSALGAEPLGSTPQELAAFIQQQTVKMAAAVKASGAKPE